MNYKYLSRIWGQWPRKFYFRYYFPYSSTHNTCPKFNACHQVFVFVSVLQVGASLLATIAVLYNTVKTRFWKTEFNEEIHWKHSQFHDLSCCHSMHDDDIYIFYFSALGEYFFSCSIYEINIANWRESTKAIFIQLPNAALNQFQFDGFRNSIRFAHIFIQNPNLSWKCPSNKRSLSQRNWHVSRHVGEFMLIRKTYELLWKMQNISLWNVGKKNSYFHCIRCIHVARFEMRVCDDFFFFF